MKQPEMTTVADMFGWMVYLAVVGGGLFYQELLAGATAAEPDDADWDEEGAPGKVLQLDAYRRARVDRRRETPGESTARVA